MFEPTHSHRTWGFRFFPTDAAVIGVLATAAIVLHHAENPLWWILIVVGGHFFLFCNIIRVRRMFELLWAGLFIANIAAWLWFAELRWTGVLCVQLPITAGLVFAEFCSARYHGVLARRTNPRLNEYLEGRIP